MDYKNLIKKVSDYTVPGIIRKRVKDSEGKKIGLDKSLAEGKRLKMLKEKVKKAGDESLETLKTARQLKNASFTSNLKGSDYDKISSDAGKKSYDFGGGRTNKLEVKKERMGLYKDLGNK